MQALTFSTYTTGLRGLASQQPAAPPTPLFILTGENTTSAGTLAAKLAPSKLLSQLMGDAARSASCLAILGVPPATGTPPPPCMSCWPWGPLALAGDGLLLPLDLSYALLLAGFVVVLSVARSLCCSLAACWAACSCSCSKASSTVAQLPSLSEAGHDCWSSVLAHDCWCAGKLPWAAAAAAAAAPPTAGLRGACWRAGLCLLPGTSGISPSPRSLRTCSAGDPPAVLSTAALMEANAAAAARSGPAPCPVGPACLVRRAPGEPGAAAAAARVDAAAAAAAKGLLPLPSRMLLAGCFEWAGKGCLAGAWCAAASLPPAAG